MRRGLYAAWLAIIAPKRAYAVIVSHAPVFWPLALQGAATLLVGWVAFARMEPLLRAELAAVNTTLPQTPPGIEDVQLFVARLMVFATALLTPLVRALLTTVTVYVTGLLNDNGASFLQTLSLAALSDVPSILLCFVQAVLLLAGIGNADYGISFSPAYFLPVEAIPSPSYFILDMLNPFSVWSWALLAAGLAVVGNVPWRRAMPQTFILVLLTVGARYALSVLMGVVNQLAPSVPLP